MISPRPSERPTGQTGRGPTMPRGLEPLKVEKKKYPQLPFLTRKSEKLRGDVRPALKVLSPLSLKFVGTKACFRLRCRRAEQM